MEYEITRHGVTYVVEPMMDDDELFAVIRSVSGLEAYCADDLSGLFSEAVHRHLTRELEKILKEDEEEGEV